MIYLPLTREQMALAPRLGITGNKMATVGTLANLAVEVKDSTTGAAIKDVRLRVKAIALEDNLTVFVNLT